MNNGNKFISVIDINTLFDFGSIAYALTKQFEEQPNSPYRFEPVSLSSLKFRTFDSFLDEYYKGDEQSKQDLKSKMKSSDLLPSVKPKLSILSQIHFLISSNLVNLEDFYVYYEDPALMQSFKEDYMSHFKELINLKQFIPLDSLLPQLRNNNSFSSTSPKEKEILISFDNRSEIKELSTLYQVVIYEHMTVKPKQQNGDVSNAVPHPHPNANINGNTHEVHYQTFDLLLEALFPSHTQKFKDFSNEEFLAKYNSCYLKKQFSFLPIWNNYFLYSKVIKLEGQIVNGVKRGSKLLGIPTANIEMNDANSLIVKNLINGVYFGMITFISNNKNNSNINISHSYKGVLSIGYNPFFNNEKKTIEVFLIDYEGDDFYGDCISLNILGYSRTEENFAGLGELVTTISYDIILGNRLLDEIKTK